MNEKLILVDENDKPIGEGDKLTVHQQALLHRAFSVFIFRRVGQQVELLLQQRQQDKYHCGGLWTNTCCSHPRVGEATLAAAQRRLLEEMGLSITLTYQGVFQYKAAFENGLTEHEVDHVFTGWYNDEEIKPNNEEVSEYRWMALDNLHADLKNHPQSYTPWFTQALKIACKVL